MIVQTRPDVAIGGRRRETEEERKTGVGLPPEARMTGEADGTETGRRTADGSLAEKEIELSGRLGQKEQI